MVEEVDDRRFWRVLLPATLAALLVSFLIRLYWRELHNLFQTYPSDIWYMHINYGWFLVNYGYFNMEYPAGMFAFVKALSVITRWFFPMVEPHKHGGLLYTYQSWLIVNSVALGLASVALTWCMHRLDAEFFRFRGNRILWAFVATPSFVFFTLFNYDVLPVLCTVAALLAWLRRDEATAFMILGVGTAVKIYPGMLLLVLLPGLPRSRWGPALAWFAGSCAAVNLPFVLVNREAWLFAYTWQMQFDNADQTGRILYTLTGWLGKGPALALVGGAGLALLAWLARRAPRELAAHPRWTAGACLVVISLFIFTKNVFSPQYLFWLLPFATLSSGYPWWGLGSAVEVVNIAEAFRLDYWRSGHEQGMVVIRAIRDAAMLALLVDQARRLAAPGREGTD